MASDYECSDDSLDGYLEFQEQMRASRLHLDELIVELQRANRRQAGEGRLRWAIKILGRYVDDDRVNAELARMLTAPAAAGGGGDEHP